MSDNKSADRLKGLTLLSANERRYPQNPEDARLETFENLYPENDYIITFDCPEYIYFKSVIISGMFCNIFLIFPSVRYILFNLCFEY